MLFLNSGDFNFNLDLSGSYHRDLFKDPSRIISKSLESEDSSLEFDRYIRDLSIDEEIDVGFFDQLKTPSEEVKPFPLVDEETANTFGNLIRESVESRVPIGRVKSIIIDEVMDHDSRRQQQTELSSSEPLTTPEVPDPSSALATTGPFHNTSDDFEAFFRLDIRNLNQYQSEPSPVSSSTSNNLNTSDSSSILSASQPQQQLRSGELKLSSNYTLPSPSSLNVHQHSSPYNQQDYYSQYQPHSRSGSSSLAYNPSSSISASNHRQNVYSPPVNTSGSSSNYTELTLPVANSIIPTVIEDHQYHSRGATSSPSIPALHHNQIRPSFSSAPSPCPSNSSMASGSTIDCKDSQFDGHSFERYSMDSQRRNSGDASGRRSRMTKKEKLDNMIGEEDRLKRENDQLKKKAETMERDVKNLKAQLMFILKSGIKSEGNSYSKS